MEISKVLNLKLVKKSLDMEYLNPSASAEKQSDLNEFR